MFLLSMGAFLAHLPAGRPRITWSGVNALAGVFSLSTTIGVTFFPSVTQAQSCRQALALGLDVSGSVDMLEYRLQLDGLSAALGSRAVRQALLASPEAPVELMVFEWSGPADQHVIMDWTAIRAPSDLAILQETLRQTVRRATSPGTAIGHALETGLAALDRRPNCWRRTLDISGDGKSNIGPAPAVVRDVLADQGVTVNALVIGADAPQMGDIRQAEIGELSSYYRAQVITGPNAFVQTALGYEAYAEAMARKLERELDTPAISALPPKQQWQRDTRGAAPDRSN
jgi:hypothetical protein